MSDGLYARPTQHINPKTLPRSPGCYWRIVIGVHLPGVTVSMRVMSAGGEYKDLRRTVAAADGDRSLSTPLTRYYAAAGTPPGQLLGSGLPGLRDGRLTAGDEVSEAQLQLLV